MKKVILGICLTLPMAAMAQEFSYDYVQLDYANSEIDAGRSDVDVEKIALIGGWAPTANSYTRLDLAYSELDNSPIDGRDYALTVGGRTSLTDCIDMYLGVTAAYKRFSDVPGSSDLDGYGLGAEIGMRSWLFPQLEVDVRGSYLDLYSGDLDDAIDTSDFTASIGARFYATPVFSIGAGYSYAVDAELNTLSAGLRYDF
ncbi:MAG: outer membrane beta-barrel protein [Pseudomonadales bacterium]|nr:outer membrane beta-barrel protein [Pseudomonadales bacterium]